MIIQGTKVPEGATHVAIKSINGVVCWYRNISGKTYEFVYSEYGVFDPVGWTKVKGEPIHEITSLAPAPWNGEGQPPVGIEVEVHPGECSWIDSDRWQIGKTAIIMAVFTNVAGRGIAAIQFEGGHCECILAECLRPVRTSAEVAAEERDAARTDILNAMCSSGNAPESETTWQLRLQIVGEILDMGYRKEVAP